MASTGGLFRLDVVRGRVAPCRRVTAEIILGFDKITPTRVMTGDPPLAILKPGTQTVWSQWRRA